MLAPTHQLLGILLYATRVLLVFASISFFKVCPHTKFTAQNFQPSSTTTTLKPKMEGPLGNDSVPEEPAPYGGIMVQGLDAENAQKQKLQQQAVEINVNGQTETLRPEALHIRGVDSLSTQNIEAFINYYLNYASKEETNEETGDVKVVYEPVTFEDQIKFKVQWVNDTSVNIAFNTHEDAIKALEAISITSSNPNLQPVSTEQDQNSEEFVAGLVQERETKPYNPVIEFQKRLDLSHRLGIETKNEQMESAGMDEDESAVVLHVRMSFQSDRKVKNASAYSRYYLLHGEPERKPRQRQYRPKRPRNRDYDRGNEDDLFANKLRGRRNRRNDDIEDDLFADKLKAKQAQRDRSRSPSRPIDRSRDRSRSPMRMEE